MSLWVPRLFISPARLGHDDPASPARQVNWDGFADAGSGVSHYEWAVGTCPMRDDLMVFTRVEDPSMEPTLRWNDGGVAMLRRPHDRMAT